MSATVEANGNVSWRKRKRQEESSELDIDMKKKPRYYYFRLASESSKGSEEDTESVYSVQDRETDVVRDTSDTDTDSKSNDESYELIEYEVASLSGSESGILGNSTSDSDDQIIVAAAIGAMCDSSLETWITDGEESDSSLDDSSITMLGFTTCVQCKSVNINPLYRYCEKCFQDRKRFYPPRPRGNKSRKKVSEPPVKLDTLRSCLSGLSSQDSGIGSSQECPSFGLDQIIIPDKHLKPGSSITDVREILQDNATQQHDRELRRKRQASESSLSDFDLKKPRLTRSKFREVSLRNSLPSSRNSTKGKTKPVSENSNDLHKQPDKPSFSLSQSSEKSLSLSQASTETCLSQTSEQTLSQTTELTLSQTSEQTLSQTSEQTSSQTTELTLSEATEQTLSQTTEQTLSQASTVSLTEDTPSLSQSSTTKELSLSSGYGSEISAQLCRTKSPENSLSLSQNSDSVSEVGASTSFRSSDGSQTSELCIICNVAPQDSIFLHTNIGHQCCCYKCAKRTLHTIKRCPICNRSVNKVVKIFKA